MTTISPTRVSMYDFLYQDTQPMISLLADTAKLSLPQTQLALGISLQAIVSALLAYQQQYQGATVSKKLFCRNAIKELRQYNSMNFATINATLYHRDDVADAIFGDRAHVIQASEYIATQIDATATQAQTLLTCLCVIVLRELAILADYSKLDNDELDKWFGLQPQFLSEQRFAEPLITKALDTEPVSTAASTIISADNHTQSTSNKEAPKTVSVDEKPILLESESMNLKESDPESAVFEMTPPAFDRYWYELTKFKPVQDTSTQDMQQATSNYLKVIGRAPENIQQGRHNDMLVFTPMSAIALPHQRWLLQLAKISDIYLMRKRLRITSEPANPPTPPLVSLGLLTGNDNDTPVTTSETPLKYDAPQPIWKNPVILIIIVVIGILSALAALKYQTQKANGATTATEAVLEQEQG